MPGSPPLVPRPGTSALFVQRSCNGYSEEPSHLTCIYCAFCPLREGVCWVQRLNAISSCLVHPRRSKLRIFPPLVKVVLCVMEWLYIHCTLLANRRGCWSLIHDAENQLARRRTDAGDQPCGGEEIGKWWLWRMCRGSPSQSPKHLLLSDQTACELQSCTD